MLGIILIIFVGRTFYRLAEEHHKSPWAFAILGVVSYYGGLLVGGFIVGLVIEVISPGVVENMNEYLLGAMAIPLGILCCYLTYVLLKKNWSKSGDIANNTLDGALIEPPQATQPSDSSRYRQDER